MSWLIMLCFLILAAVNDNCAAPVYTATGHASLANQSQEQARVQALWAARWDAVSQAQIAVSGGTLHLEQERRGSSGSREEFYEAFSKMVSAEAGGVIGDEEILTESVETISGPEGRPLSYYKITIRAEVVPDSGRPDPGFALDLSSDKESYRDGDSLVIRLSASKPCWVTLFHISGDDQVTLISPHVYWGNPRLQPGQTIEIPPLHVRQETATLPVTLPVGQESCADLLLAVAYKDSSDIFCDYTRTDPRRLESFGEGLQKINQWILSIPRDKRVADYATFGVGKK